MARIALFVLLFLLGSLAPAAAQQGARVALVVGVADYKHAPKLLNTVNDARDMAAALGKLGFKVDLVLDPDRAALEGAVRRFGQMSVGAEASVFHYSGHALEFGGRNWLVPTTAEFDSGRNIRFEALDLDSVLEQTDGNARVTVVFLDACRDNPFLRRLASRTRDIPARGLGRVDTTASGVLVAFSNAPGQVASDGEGRNSPFTAAILSRIETPGLEIKAMMTQVTRDVVDATSGKQRPWQNSSLQGDFYFKAATVVASPPPAPVAPPPPSGPSPLDIERLYWESIVASTDPADFRAYLTRFPAGVFVDLARNRIARLTEARATPAPTPSVATEAAAGAAPPQPRPPRATTADGPTERLAALLQQGAPTLASERREQVARDYLRASAPKAIAFVPGTSMVWRATGRGSVDIARTAALEGCQIYAGRPCALLAVNDQFEADIGAQSPVRASINVNHGGRFDIDRIPVEPAAFARREDVRAYASSRGAKAIALHPVGRVYVVTSAAGQPEAEESALAACRADPANASAGGVCHLYAAGMQVVLPKRLTAPRPAPTNLPEAYDYLGLGQDYLRSYAAYAAYKAHAIEPLSRRNFRSYNFASQELADNVTLEGCQMHYGAPCVLFASGDALRAPDITKALPRPMPRLAWAGNFDPARVPGFRDPKRREFLAYQKMTGARAMAIRADSGRIGIAGGKTTLEAQTKALAACNDPDPAFPCIVYAVDDKVVFARRATEPIR